MITFFLYFLGLVFSIAIFFIFYPYKVQFTGNNVNFYVRIDLAIVDFFYIKKKQKYKSYVKFLGFFRFLKKAGKIRKEYSPNYDRIYFVIRFLTKHIMSVFSFVSINMLGLHIQAGFPDYYMLSQLSVINVLINNYLKDGFFIDLYPDFEKTSFAFHGRADISFHLNRVIWFFVKLLIHPATYSGIYEYYRYYKSTKTESAIDN